MISAGEALYYIEYLDHGLISSNFKEFEKNPLILWACGKIAHENNDFVAVVCSGVKNREPSSKPQLEIIVKKAIITKELIHTVA